MNLLLDGWSALQRDLVSVLAVLACMLWGSTVIVAVLRRFADADFTAAEYLSLALGGWIVPAFLLAVLLFVIALLVDLPPNLSFAAIVLLASAIWSIVRTRRPQRTLDSSTYLPLLALAALFVLGVVVRLAFIVRTPLPLYFDSAEHYRIIQSLMGDYAGRASQSALAWPVSTYYHLGSHLLLAVLTSISQQDLGRMILVSGQIVMASVPVSLFWIVRRETGSSGAGLLAVILGMAGWYMPAYAVNWGKYPALFALPAIFFSLGAAYLAAKVAGGRRRRTACLVLATLAASVAFFIQTRSAILLGIAFLSWVLARWWTRLPAPRRLVIVGLLVFILFLQALLVARNTVLGTLLDPYLGSGLPLTALVGLLAVPAVVKHPQLAFCCLLTMVLLLVGLFVPVPTYTLSPLLDRPLVEMVLSIPLALLGAAGFAGALEYLAPLAALWRAGILAALSLAIAAHAFANYGFYPAECCVLVHADDLVAIDWMKKNLAADARVSIASTALRYAPPPYPPIVAGSDAGVWILPLAGRQVSNLSYTTDFRDPGTLDQLCQQGITDVYVSDLPQSFGAASLDAKPDWYEILLLLPGARIYRVAACSS